MRTSAVAGIILANINDNLLKKLTSMRSMASIPIGARYRLIDFPLSNLVNAGVTSVGIITKENYRSLMDHVGNGAPWELDRKHGGLYLLPPYLTSGVRRYSGTVDALYGARDYIKRCGSEYVILCNADVLANIDIKSVVDAHIEKNADVTVLYHKGKLTEENRDNLHMTMDKDNRITKMEFETVPNADTACGIGVTVISRELLLKFVNEAYDEGLVNFNRDYLSGKVGQFKIYGYEHEGYVCFMNGTDSYFKASMDMLKPEVRKQLFNRKRPIFTKTRDDMPTRYGINSVVKNCLIADGCIIEGTVKNSIISRGVKVEKGAVVENCILMQETKVGADAQLNNVISDKNAVISEEMILKGTKEKQFFVKKNQII